MKKLALLVSMVLASSSVLAITSTDYEVTNTNKFNSLVNSKQPVIVDIVEVTEDSDMFGVMKRVIVEHESKNDKYQLFTYETVDCASKTHLITQYATFDKSKNKYYMYADNFKVTKTSKNLHLENLVVSAVCGNMIYEAL